MLDVGDSITFNSRRGYIIGHWVGKRYGYRNPLQSFYIVELDKESQGWIKGDNDKEDAFCSITLIAVENAD